MNSSRFSLWIGLSLLAGLALGYSLAPRNPAVSQTPARNAASDRSTGSRFAVNAPGGSYDAGVLENSRGRETSLAEAQGDVATRLNSVLQMTDFYRRRRDLYDFAANLSPEEVENAMNLIESASPADRSIAQFTILDRWLDIDAAAALGWLAELPPGEHKRSLLGEAFSLLGRKQPTAGIEMLRQLKDQNVTDVGGGLHQLFRAWAQNDPASAAQSALALPSARDRSSAVYASVGSWAEKDPRGAWAWAAQLTDRKMRAGVMQTLISEWSEQDPVNAAAATRTIAEVKQRDRLLVDVARNAAKNHPEVVREIIAELPVGAVRDDAIRSAINSAASSNPEAAAEFFALGSAEIQRSYGYQIASHLTRRDPAAAVKWVATIGSEQERSRMLSTVLSTWITEAPDAAMQYALQHHGSEPSVIANVFSAWAQTDVESALSKANSVANPEARDRALAACYGSLATTDPQRALKEAERLNGDAKRNAILQITMNWANESPADAANWAIRNASAETSALHSILHQWTRQYPVQAAQWLDTLSAGKQRDTAIDQFINAIRTSEPETAAAWALTIQDERQRASAVQNVFSSWFSNNRTAAVEWLKTATGVSDEMRQQLLRSRGIQ